MSGAGMSVQEPPYGGVNTKLLAMDTIGRCSQVKEPLVASMSCSSEGVWDVLDESAGTWGTPVHWCVVESQLFLMRRGRHVVLG